MIQGLENEIRPQASVRMVGLTRGLGGLSMA